MTTNSLSDFFVNLWRAFADACARIGQVAASAAMLLTIFTLNPPTTAQPAGWSEVAPIFVANSSATSSTGYQLRMVINTSAMAASAADLRFGADAAGATLLDYWIESGAGTATTVVWVKLPALIASGNLTIYMFSGNPVANRASTVNVFDYVDANANSATNQVASGDPGGASNSQRGFRFAPNEDVLLTQFGKREPNGTTRYITLFDNVSQAIIAQQRVSGPAATYTYTNATQPRWLTSGTQYLLLLYQSSSDAYYHGTSAQINSKLTYFDMRYCNSCTENTFPTSFLTNFHSGYPDFQFRTKKTLSPTPTYTSATRTIGGTVSGLAGSGLVLSLSAGSTQTLGVNANGSFAFASPITDSVAYAVTVQTQPSSPSQSCSVSSGTGAAGSANVTNVSVTCSTNSYTVGGTVSGLSGSGLVLSLNSGAQTLPVNANGSATFPTALASGAAYTVTVGAQPSGPAQTCTVANGSGTVGAANVTSISITCSNVLRAVSVVTTGAPFTATPPIPASVADGTVLTFTITLGNGTQLLAASGCGGSLGGNVFTTAPITANCTITVSAQLTQVPAVPTVDPLLLALLAAALALVGWIRQRSRTSSR